MKKSTLFTLLVALFLAGCSRQARELPPITQQGANTFGAMLDGGQWIPRQFASIAGNVLEARITGNGDLVINARDFSSTPTETEFEILVKGISGEGIYLLNKETARYPGHSGSYGYFIERELMPVEQWITGPQHGGMVQISRYDTAARIVSGVFEFRAASLSGSSTIQVTEGRFDLVYQ